jgi:hypothetical protein
MTAPATPRRRLLELDDEELQQLLDLAAGQRQRRS